MATSTENIYRIRLFPDTKTVTVLPIGMNCIDSSFKGDYAWDDLPAWVREKLTVLSALHIPPPPNSVEGLGERISETVFWVYG